MAVISRHSRDDRLGFANMDFFKEGMNINIGILFWFQTHIQTSADLFGQGTTSTFARKQPTNNQRRNQENQNRIVNQPGQARRSFSYFSVTRYDVGIGSITT